MTKTLTQTSMKCKAQHSSSLHLHWKTDICMVTWKNKISIYSVVAYIFIKVEINAKNTALQHTYAHHFNGHANSKPLESHYIVSKSEES